MKQIAVPCDACGRPLRLRYRDLDDYAAITRDGLYCHHCAPFALAELTRTPGHGARLQPLAR